jgi:hypothetical protein
MKDDACGSGAATHLFVGFDQDLRAVAGNNGEKKEPGLAP